MNKKLGFLILLIVLICLGFVIFSTFYTNPDQDRPTSQDQSITDWSEMRSDFSSNCKLDNFTKEQMPEHLLFLSNQHPRIDEIRKEHPNPYLIMYLPKNSQYDIEDPNTPKCWLAFSNYIDDYTEIIYQTENNQTKIIQVVNFPKF